MLAHVGRGFSPDTWQCRTSGALPISYVSGLKPGPTCSYGIGLLTPQLSIEEQDLHINRLVICYILRGNKPLSMIGLRFVRTNKGILATGERVL